MEQSPSREAKRPSSRWETPAFYGTALPNVRHLSLFWARAIHPFPLLVLYQRISPNPTHCEMFRNMLSFYSEDLLAPRPTPRLGVTPCRPSAISYSIYSQLSSMSGDPSSIRSLRTLHAVVTGTHLTRPSTNSKFIFSRKEQFPKMLIISNSLCLIRMQ